MNIYFFTVPMLLGYTDSYTVITVKTIFARLTALRQVCHDNPVFCYSFSFSFGCGALFHAMQPLGTNTLFYQYNQLNSVISSNLLCFISLWIYYISDDSSLCCYKGSRNKFIVNTFNSNLFLHKSTYVNPILNESSLANIKSSFIIVFTIFS